MLKAIIQLIGKAAKSNGARRIVKEACKSGVKKRHHQKAISQALRLGSTEAAKVMSKWRWGK